MNPERLRQIEELYHAAREGTPEERAALLAQADPELRREVESLLSERAGGEFLDRPAILNAPHLPEYPSTLTVMASGACLGPYRIESKLGEGGMGEVFRAIDTRLGRAVAIKTTRDQFSAPLFDVGPNYLVMELVEGETLAVRLKQEPLPIQTSILYACQIAAALVEAHSKGIVHRDLKPGNIIIGKSGVKVLDFGLARSGQDETVTASNMVVGTPAYMAPEQREGKTADARTDIYAFGCILYEMFTGARVGLVPPRRIQPRRLGQIVNRCLEQDSARRWQSAAELQRELAAVKPLNRKAYRVAAASVLALVVASGYFFLRRPPKLSPKDTVVLADFENKTGDPVFDQTLRQGLTVQLEQSPFLTLVSDQQAQQALAS